MSTEDQRPHDDETLPYISEIVPDRDDVESYQRNKTGKQKLAADPVLNEADSYDEEPAVAGKTPLYVLGAIVLLLAWAGFLQWQLVQTQADLGAWQLRVADLEKRLSVTDESANQSVASLQVKLKDTDDAITKLRDDSFKHAKATLDQHTTQLAAIDQTLKATQGTASKLDKTVDEQQKVLDSAKGQLDKLAPTVDAAKRKNDEQQVAIDALTEKGNAATANIEKLNVRMSTNEEWVQSINNFRKQTNREIVDIKQQISGPIKETPPK